MNFLTGLDSHGEFGFDSDPKGADQSRPPPFHIYRMCCFCGALSRFGPSAKNRCVRRCAQAVRPVCCCLAAGARKSPSDPPPIGSDAVALIFQGCHSQIYFRNYTHHSFLQRSSRKVTCVSLINQIFSSHAAKTKNTHRLLTSILIF